jgi:hypoxanthine-DNA glycosylase
MPSIHSDNPHLRGVSCLGFPPIVTPRSRVLVLGSMPGVQSLQHAQYYYHPQNSFWKIMAKLFGMPVETYAQRIALIKKSDLALWDSLKACDRPGSLDSKIAKDSIVVNDFAGLFARYPKIGHVFWNGGTSAGEFKKRVMPTLPENVKERIIFQQLPSTSPAMATKNFAQKLREWQAVKEALDSDVRPAPASRTSRAKGG